MSSAPPIRGRGWQPPVGTSGPSTSGTTEGQAPIKSRSVPAGGTSTSSRRLRAAVRSQDKHQGVSSFMGRAGAGGRTSTTLTQRGCGSPVDKEGISTGGGGYPPPPPDPLPAPLL